MNEAYRERYEEKRGEPFTIADHEALWAHREEDTNEAARHQEYKEVHERSGTADRDLGPISTEFLDELVANVGFDEAHDMLVGIPDYQYMSSGNINNLRHWQVLARPDWAQYRHYTENLAGARQARAAEEGHQGFGHAQWGAEFRHVMNILEEYFENYRNRYPQLFPPANLQLDPQAERRRLRNGIGVNYRRMRRGQRRHNPYLERRAGQFREHRDLVRRMEAPAPHEGGSV
jgi:hypothetical protein